MNELDIFAAAWEIDDPEKRSAYLEQVCEGDLKLRQQIEQMLELAKQDNSFMELGAGEATAISRGAIAAVTVGAQIGPYKLKEKIGEGGMGVVFVAEQKQPVRRRVALKIIKPGMDSQQVIARFEAERQALAMMDHPNIAKVLDAGTTESGLPYFVMELVNGTPINRYCDENQLSIRERLDLFRSVCEGVQHAHQKGIIHRDLKPANILVAQYDSRPVPKVIDFGVAKATGQMLSDHSIYTQLGQVLGTLEYMSPEQAQRNQLDIDTRSDIYSLGVVLYELLTGELPFDKTRLRSAALEELFRIIREEEPPRPSARVSTSGSKVITAKYRKSEPSKLGTLFRGELDWIVMKAMDKDRKRRYESANGLATDISRFLTNQPVQACPPSSFYQLKKFSKRNQAAVVFIATVSMLLITGILVSSRQAYRAARAEKEAKRQQEQTSILNDQLSSKIVELESSRQATDRERVRATRNLEFLKKSIVSPSLLGPKATVVDLIVQIYEQLDSELTDDPETKLDLLNWIGSTNIRLNEPRLKDCPDRTLILMSELFGSDDPRTIYVRLKTTIANRSLKSPEIIENLKELVAFSESTNGKQHPITLKCIEDLAVRLGQRLGYFYRQQIVEETGTQHDESIHWFEILDRRMGLPIRGEAQIQLASEPLVVLPDHNDVRLNLTREYIETGKYEKAIALCKEQIERTMHNSTVSTDQKMKWHNLLANAYQLNGNPELAIATLKSWVSQFEDLEDIDAQNSTLLLADIYLMQGNYKKAVELVRSVYELDSVQKYLSDPAGYHRNFFRQPEFQKDGKTMRPGYCTNLLEYWYGRYLDISWKRDGGDEDMHRLIKVNDQAIKIRIETRVDDELGVQYLKVGQALVYHALGDWSKSVEIFEQYMEYWRRKGMPENLLQTGIFGCRLKLAEGLISLDRLPEAIQILEGLNEYVQDKPDHKDAYDADRPHRMVGQVANHLLAYSKFKLAPNDPTNEDWLTELANIQFKYLVDETISDTIREEFVKEFYEHQVDAQRTIERVIEYFKARDDAEKVQLWNQRLQEIRDLKNPNAK